jgi:hypothetical protein
MNSNNIHTLLQYINIILLINININNKQKKSKKIGWGNFALFL